MVKVKEHAKRAVIILAVVAFAMSSVLVTILYFVQAKNDQKTQDQQSQNLDQIQAQASCPGGPQNDKKVAPPATPQNPIIAAIPTFHTEDLSVGTGSAVKEGDCVNLFYYGTLAKDGKAFSGGSNYADGIPYQSVTTSFVPGFAKGLVGMKAGGERRIYIPAAEGYGAQASGEIPANADLIFTVKITEVVQK